MINALIVDDEPLARVELEYLLSEQTDFKVLKSVPTVAEAKDVLKSHTVQVIFLDIQLRAETGFDLIEYIHPNTKIIFVTAHDEFAVQAFRVNALDYLLKPIDDTEFQAALDKVRQNIPQPDFFDFSFREQIIINFDKRRYAFSPQDLIAIKAGDNHIYDLYFKHKKLFFRRTIKEWMEILNENIFMQIHRNSIINLRYIEDVDGSNSRVKMKYIPEYFDVSRSNLSRIKEIPLSP